MSLDLSAVGFTSEATSFTYDWKAVALYALGIGAKKTELDYVFEGKGPKVYPTFAVIPSMPAIGACLGKTNGNPAMIVHGGQRVKLHRSFPSEGRLLTTATVKGIYDMKKMGQVVVETNTTLHDGSPLVDCVWSIIFRGAGGFDGPPPPKGEDVSAPKDRPADFHFEQATTTEQALLYRLSGDLNPLHADPEFATMVGFPQGPILHGLCTYGFAARAIILEACGGDASRLKSIDGQFRKPVWPGETLVVDGWKLDGDKVAVITTVKERGDTVMPGWAQLG